MSKRTGDRCKNMLGPGQRTCRMHGSATKKSKIAAARRIAEASGYAADMLVEFMADPSVDLKQRTQIAQDLLDRAGYNGKIDVNATVTVSAWESSKQRFIKTVHIGEMEAKALETVVDAELIEEDPEYEAELDERSRQSEALRGKRKRQGHPASLPSEDPAPRLARRPPAPSRPPTPEPADFAAEPPTRKTDAEWRAEGRARARQADSAERRTARRGKGR